MRRALGGTLTARLLAALLAWGAAAVAHAQTCHTSTRLPSDAPALRVSVSLEAAGYRNTRYEGSYQGFSVLSSWGSERVRLELGLPAYTLVRNGLRVAGLGDVWLSARWQAWQSDNGAFQTGLALVTAAPTGDPMKDLGMGHWMLTPTAWAQWEGEQVFSELELGFGRALGAHAGHGTGAGFPLVNPMNPSELGGKVSAGLRLGKAFSLRAGLDGFAPVVLAGTSRASVFAGTDLRVGSLEASVAVHLPVAGAPYDVKALAAVGLAF
jgi:hypothetical protein